MKLPFSTPRIVVLLGYGGLIPFMSLAGISLTTIFPRPFVESAMFYYAATILSFVAALHWGFAMTIKSLSEQEQTRRYLWSVIPPLLAWVALLMAPTICTLILIGGFIAHLWQDIVFHQRPEVELPKWYLPLRIRLTTIAVSCLTVLLIQSPS